MAVTKAVLESIKGKDLPKGLKFKIMAGTLTREDVLESVQSGELEDIDVGMALLEGMPIPDSKCPMPIKQFKDNALPLEVMIGEFSSSAAPQQFSTDGYGWYLATKADIPVGDTKVECRIAVTITVAHSKPIKISDR